MANLLEGGFMSGKKTYIVAAVAIIGALGAWAVGEMSLIEAGGVVLGALGFGGLRDAIGKK